MITIRLGSRGEDVKVLQNYLGLKADGIFGLNTEKKVKEWQKANGLTPDGVIGQKSWAIILNNHKPNLTPTSNAKKLYILLDNGHGNNTQGKRSPKFDNGTQLFEYAYCRKVVDTLYNKLKQYGEFYPIKITPELNDISLGTRVNRINSYCKKYGASNCIMISVHLNAAGNGNWMSARGWSTWTTKGTTSSDKLAECLYEGADIVINANKDYINSFKGVKNQKPIREDKSDGDRDWEANYQIIKGANCPSTLSENFFMDNKQDATYLMSNKGLEDVVNIHLEGIKKYYNKYFK